LIDLKLNIKTSIREFQVIHLNKRLVQSHKIMPPIRIHYIQHVPFEGLGSIEEWIFKNNHPVTSTKFFENHSLPVMDEFDWLIIMGGPMGVYDKIHYPWLKEEKEFIREAIEKDKTVIGICLGAQLIAAALGARVYPNKHREIGWFDIENPVSFEQKESVFKIDGKLTVFHWHGDTFDLPKDSLHLFASGACINQGFLFKENVLGLQFHFEATPESVNEMVVNGVNELVPDEFVQSHEEIINQVGFYKNSNNIMFRILDHMINRNIASSRFFG
jgi:GMP synthase-like glutamine amidotransferase